MSVRELKELEVMVSKEIEERAEKMVVIKDVMEKMKEIGLEVSDLLAHYQLKGKRGRKAKTSTN